MTVAVRRAATVVLVRDGEHGEAPLEVLMLRRREGSGFVPGAHVFPGGALDPEDHEVPLPEGSGLDPLGAARALGLDDASQAIAHWFAAIRETFEESGALLARRPDGEPVVAEGTDLAGRLERHRRDVETGQRLLVDVLRDEGLLPAVDQLRYLARWITPLGAPRRYDTRFFLAPAPQGQRLSADGTECTELDWFRPAEALALHRSGELELILPTQRTLELLGAFPTAGDVLHAVDEVAGRPLEAEEAGAWCAPLDVPPPATGPGRAAR